MLTHDRPFQQPGIGRGRRAITGADTVIASDQGNTIDITSGTFSLAFTAAATLGNKFHVAIYNSGSGVVTLDPNGAETIRTPAGTAATLALTQGQGVCLSCDGSNFDVILAIGLPASPSTALTVRDNAFTITGNVDTSKLLVTQVDTQATGLTTTLDVGAQTGSFSATLPVMPANRTFAMLEQTQSWSAVNTFNNNQIFVGQIQQSSNATSTGAIRLLADDSTSTIAIGGQWTTAKFDSQGTAWTARTLGGALIFNHSSSLRGEIDWYRGSNTYPEFAIREHTTANTGGEVWAGSGSVAPTKVLEFSATALTTAVNISQTGATTFSTGTGVSTFNCTTEASAIGTAGTVIVGGVSHAKRRYGGTIGSTFKGNVDAGVQDGTAAVSGQVGEVLSSTVTAAAVAATGTVGNVTSVSLTAGDWLISGFVNIAGGATGLTTGSVAKLSIVTTTATNGTDGSTMAQSSVETLVANGLKHLAIPQIRVNISATTTYYLTEQVTYAGGSPTAAGVIIATRIR